MADQQAVPSKETSTTVPPQSSPASYLLPYATLQSTYAQVYDDVALGRVRQEEVWLSLYAENAPQKSVHATLQLKRALDADQAVSPVHLHHTRGGKAVVRITQQAQLTVSGAGGTGPSDIYLETTSSNRAALDPTRLQNHPSLLRPTVLRLPRYTRAPLIKGTRSERVIERGAGGTISAFDVSPDGSHFVAGGEDGEAILGSLPYWLSTSTISSQRTVNVPICRAAQSVGERARQRMKEVESDKRQDQLVPLEGHLGDLRSAQFFPSGQVILTASVDSTIRLYSLSGTNARTFKGHKRAVTCTAMLGRGKRLVSASLDGTLRLWDVASERCLRIVTVRNMSGVESLSVVSVDHDVQSEAHEESLGRYLVFAGLSSGHVDVFSFYLTLSKPSRPAQVGTQFEKEEPACPAQIRVQDFWVKSLTPVIYPSDVHPSIVLNGPEASEFWNMMPSGAVWSLDVSAGQEERESCKLLHLAAGTKNGVVRLFAVDVASLVSLAKLKEAAGEASTTTTSMVSTHSDAAGDQDEESLQRQAIRELLNLRRNAAGINAVRFVPDVTPNTTSIRPPRDLIVATADGTPFRLAFASDETEKACSSPDRAAMIAWTPYTVEEYTGWEAGDSVNAIGLIPTRDNDDLAAGEAGAQGWRIALAGAEGTLIVY